ncbi:MAG: hypothetical protein RR487_06680 [Acinetobacter sp.]
MFKKSLLGTILGFVLINPSFASEQTERTQVLKTINNYVGSVACATSKITSNDIFKIDSDKESGIATYYVFWVGDKGCQGGSGTMSAYVSEVTRYSSSRPFLVMSDDVFGDNNEKVWSGEGITKPYINYRFVNSIKQISPEKFEIIAGAYADDKFGGKDGGNNFPANTIKYTLQDVKGYGWQITNQKLIKQNN